MPHRTDYAANQHIADAIRRHIVDRGLTAYVALRSGWTERFIYKLAANERTLSGYQLPRLVAAADNDLRLLSDMVAAERLGAMVVAQPKVAPSATDSRSATLKVAAMAGQVAQLIDDIEADGVVTASEFVAASAEIDKAQRSLESLRSTLRQQAFESPVTAVTA
jgi:hypothetical protein